MAKKLICALLYAEAKTEIKAQAIARRFSSCPYIFFLGTKKNQYYATYFLPPEKRDWIEYAENHPQETYGFETVQVTFLDEVQFPQELIHLFLM